MSFLSLFELFFGWLFGGKKSEKKAEKEKIEFSQFDAWVEKNSEKEFKRLLEETLPRFAEIKHLLKEINSGLSELSEKNVEEDEKGNKRLRKIVGTSARTFAEHMKKLLAKLQPPALAEFDAVCDYCLGAWPLMEREIASFGKNAAYAAIVLKEEVSGIGSNIKELDSLLKQLHDSFAGTQSVRFSAELKDTSLRLGEKLSERLSLHDSLAESTIEIKKLQENNALLEKKLSSLSESEEFKALSELEAAKAAALQKKEKLRSELVDLLAPIDKPLRRLESLAESRAFVLKREEKDFLKTFLRDPLLAIRQDPRADVLKRLLLELQQAIDSEKISLKDGKEKEKRLASLQQLSSFDFFSNFFWKSNQIEVELQKLEKELLQNSSSQDKAALERSIGSEKKALEEKSRAIGSLKKKRDGLDNEISSLKQALEDLAKKAFGKETEIILG